MTLQMLFYQHAVPVSAGRHAGCSVAVGDHRFSRRVNSVPLTAVEFRMAAAEYPIVFASGSGELHPLAVLGLRSQQNLFVSEEGGWDARYVPAFVRRYPFVFSATADDQRYTLCVDEAFDGLNREGRGQPLFTVAPEPSDYVGRVLRFLQDYRAQFVRTRAFCRRLEELGVLVPMQARFQVAGRTEGLGGFCVVDRARLKAAPADRLLALIGSDELELLYLHLQSLRNFEALSHRLHSADAPEPVATAAAAASAPHAGVTLH